MQPNASINQRPRYVQAVRAVQLVSAMLLVSLISCTHEAPVSTTVGVDPNNDTTNTARAAVTDTSDTFTATPYEHTLPLGLPEYYVRETNPMTHEKVELGRKLFFDNALSGDNSMSCATCHDPKQGWSNGERFALGVNGESGTRNVPTIVNSAFSRSHFWDGRAGSLEGQALGPIMNKGEMGMPSKQVLVDRLNEHAEYPELFAKAFPNGITATNVARALASYERTIVAGNSPYDRYLAGEKDAMSESARRGMELFMDKRKSKCSICHEPPMFTAMFYHNLGVGMEAESPDLGRHVVTKLESNKGQFKVPSVRDVKDTAPFMHDGSIATLKEVVEFYDKGGIPNRYLAKDMRGKLNLTQQEKDDLVAFMVEGLTSDKPPTP